MDEIKRHLKLKKPCHNCPFKKDGAINLADGRLENIISTLVTDDMSTFQCHQTVHNAKTGGEFDDDGNYQASGKESMCAGAMIYLEKLGRPTVMMRLGRLRGVYHPDQLKQQFESVIEPSNKDNQDE